MATGELSAFYLYWILQRAEPFSLILIEEPEAFLPPLSHDAIFALICDQALKKRLGIVITTHSSSIASQVSQHNLLSIRRQAGVSILPSTAESKIRVLSRLGLGPRRHSIFFVEDEVAKLVLEEVISIFEFKLVCQIEVVVAVGGASAVKAMMEALPVGISSVRFAGVLDGDMRTTAAAWPCAEQLEFLPFSGQMEEEILSEISAKPAKMAKLLNRGRERLEDALLLHAGLDAHDKFRAVAEELDVQLEALVRAGLEVWSRRAGNRAGVGRFARALAGRIGVELPHQS